MSFRSHWSATARTSFSFRFLASWLAARTRRAWLHTRSWSRCVASRRARSSQSCLRGNQVRTVTTAVRQCKIRWMDDFVLLTFHIVHVFPKVDMLRWTRLKPPSYQYQGTEYFPRHCFDTRRCTKTRKFEQRHRHIPSVFPQVSVTNTGSYRPFETQSRYRSVST